MDEKQLIKQCLKQNPQAQKKLFDVFSPIMMGLCIRYMGRSDLAGDALQQAFLTVFEKLDSFDFKGSFEGWIRRIVINSCLDLLRKQKAYKYGHSEVAMDEMNNDPGVSPEIDNEHNAQFLLDLIAELPDGYRLVFNMHAIEGYSHKEISDKLGMTESTSRSQLRKAKNKLKGMLEIASKETEL